MSRHKASASKRVLELTRTRHQTIAKAIDATVGVLRTAIRASAWVGVSFFAFKSIETFAGRPTDIKAVIDAVVDLQADQWIAWMVAVLAGGGYLHERRLRQKTIAGQTSHIHELERKIDPRRSSSRLTRSGQPTPEDLDGA